MLEGYSFEIMDTGSGDNRQVSVSQSERLWKRRNNSKKHGSTDRNKEIQLMMFSMKEVNNTLKQSGETTPGKGKIS